MLIMRGKSILQFVFNSFLWTVNNPMIGRIHLDRFYILVGGLCFQGAMKTAYNFALFERVGGSYLTPICTMKNIAAVDEGSAYHATV